MATSSSQWLERLQELANKLRTAPSGSGQAEQLQKLLDKWQRSRAALDQDFIVQLSFFLGTLSGQVKDANILALIQELMKSRNAPAPAAKADVSPTPTAQSESAKSAKSTKPAPNDEVFIDFDNPDEPKTQPFIKRPPAPPLSRKPWTPGFPGSANPPENTAASGAAKPAEHSPQVRQARRDLPGDFRKDPGASKFGRRSGEQGAGPGYPEVERRVNSAYRLHLESKHGEIEKLQELLAQKASEALSQNKQFGDLLKTERAALEQASNLNDIHEMKQILIGSADELLAGQKDLEDKLRSSFEYLEVVKSDSEILHSELTKVRMLSLTDENTGLPNRRAFLRRLEEEIMRAEQYGIPLTLALIDLDFFKEINDQYGHPAGDVVLNWYAREGLPIFRHYDMIARYGGEEFAVLFPGTTAEGAGRAIAKLREHVARKTCVYDDQVIDVPTFSAGLASFREGEDKDSLIKRADQALYRAKSMGRDQTALEQRMPPIEGANGREP